ncbi:MAG: Bug family tripartite tricarboxylate transporter substrate binding protein [Burkholderiaceae bacterium]
MTPIRRTRLRALAAACVLGATFSPLPAAAQAAWPSKPIRLVVTFPPGGSSDIVARVIGPLLAERLGQPILVENRPGAGATIGAAAVANAAPDGYTLMMSNTAPISISPFMLEKPTYDPIASFSHVFYVGSVPNVFVVHPSVPAKTMPELQAWLKQQKDPTNFGSGGVGSIGHIVGEIYANASGTKLQHIGYKGSAPMHTDLIGGTIKLAVDSLPQNFPFFKSGQLRGLAVTSRERMAMAPDLPTVLELGMPELVAENFLGLSGPAGLPPAVIDTLHKAMTDVMKRPDLKTKLDELAIASRPMTPAEFTAFVKQQVGAWGPAVKASGAKLQ